MSTCKHITYNRPDAVVGVGFQIEHGGRSQHSVAWPDRPAQRFTSDELERLGISCDLEAEDPPQAVEGDAGEQQGKPVDPADLPQPAADTDPPEDPTETDEEPDQQDAEPVTEAEAIRKKLEETPKATNKEIVEALAADGIKVSSSQVSRQKKNLGL